MDIKPETFIHALERHEIYVSSNTACSSGKLSTSVMALYNDKKRAETTIRISLSCLTKLEEITVFLNAFNGVYEKLHSSLFMVLISPFSKYVTLSSLSLIVCP